MTDRAERRLAAILAADVAGYSRLMGADEEGTLHALTTHRRELIDPKVAEHRGRIVKTTGDGVLVEFASIVDAVRYAVEIQREMVARNAAVAQDKRIEFRVGINVGDIIIQGGDIFGDGVNVAARLEALAESGGICLSADAFSQVRDRLDLAFDDLGDKELKNIARPVRVYRVRPLGKQEPAQPSNQTVRLSLPNRPSIAVLTFLNMSGDPEQEYFADGIAEDIITGLSRFRWLDVIARNSSFTFKGRNVDVRTIGRELGVRYVLEGSVRRGGNRLRITAQLVEAETGNHLWAEKYDGALEDVFALQDKITEGVVAAIEPSVRQAEIERARRKRTENLDAYDLYLRALPHAWANTPDEAEMAIDLLDRALLIERNYIAAHGILAWCLSQRSRRDAQRASDMEHAVQHARAVTSSGTDDATALAFAGFVLAVAANDLSGAIAAVTRAIEISPNSATALIRSAAVHAVGGRYETAIEHATRAIRLSPLDPSRYTSEISLSIAHFQCGRFAEAEAAAQRSIKYNPQFDLAYGMLVASCMRLGRIEDANRAKGRLMTIRPDFRIGQSVLRADAIAAALREAGLPE